MRWDGQAWTTLDHLTARHAARIEDEAASITGIECQPDFAIGQRALLLQSPAGNVLWDCIALIDDEIVAQIEKRGGLRAIAISHPHYYTTMVEWSDAFGGVPIYLHADDRQWIQRNSPQIVCWEGETHAINADMTLIRCGGHFDGATVLHWPAYGGMGALFTGDVLQVTMDRKHVSFMYSYPNMIPLNRAKIEAIRQAIAGRRYDCLFGAFRKRNIIGGADAAVARSFERYLQAIADTD